MKAVVFENIGQWSIHSNHPDPTCGLHDVIVQVQAAGICGTDHHILKGEFLQNFPVIPGHEFAGNIVEVGKEVTHLHIGDRVAVDPGVYCGECYFCQRQQNNHCLNWNGIGITYNGGFAEYAAAPAGNCYLLPDRVTYPEGAFVEPLACVIHGLNRMRIFPGDDVLLFGAGPIGLLLLQAMRHNGASRIIVVDKQETRLAMATSMGAYATVLAGPDQKAQLTAYAPYGYSIVADATGIPAVVQQAIQYIKPRGQYFQFGVNPPDATIEIKPFDIYRHDWNMIGSFATLYNFHPAIAWVDSCTIDVKPLISHFLPLDKFGEGLELSGSGQALKVQHGPF